MSDDPSITEPTFEAPAIITASCLECGVALTNRPGSTEDETTPCKCGRVLRVPPRHARPAAPAEDRRRYIRHDDYYGGNVYVVMPKAEWDNGNDGAFYGGERALSIVWRAWGGYGMQRLSLQSALECRDLAAALLDAANTIDPDEFND